MSTQTLLVSYSTFKLAAQAGAVYYIAQTTGYLVYCVAKGNIFNCLIDNSSDIADFESNVKPTGTLAISQADALGLCLLSSQAQASSVSISADQRLVHVNATLTTNGNSVYSNISSGCSLILNTNILNAPTGSSPNLRYFLQEVDPGDLTTLLGSAVSGTILTGAGTSSVSITPKLSCCVKVTWAVTGTGASFTGVYSTMVSKPFGLSANKSTPSTVAGSISSTQLLASNPNRVGATIFNDSTSILYVHIGNAAALTSFNVRLLPNGYYEVPYKTSEAIYGIWVSATGNARILELT